MRGLVLGIGILCAGALLRADVANCACDPLKPESLKARECGLCVEAENHSSGAPYFLVKDINPRKPSRWLLLPKAHTVGSHALHLLPAAERLRLWQAAVEKARMLFGDEWGIAYNGEKSRTQCHLHVHIGRWIKASENRRFVTVRRLDEIEAPEHLGIWIHPVRGGYHVHAGEGIAETVLVR